MERALPEGLLTLNAPANAEILFLVFPAVQVLGALFWPANAVNSPSFAQSFLHQRPPTLLVCSYKQLFFRHQKNSLT
jgi:hypothetical protein